MSIDRFLGYIESAAQITTYSQLFDITQYSITTQVSNPVDSIKKDLFISIASCWENFIQ